MFPKRKSLGSIKQISDVQRRHRSIYSLPHRATDKEDGNTSGHFLFCNLVRDLFLDNKFGIISL